MQFQILILLRKQLASKAHPIFVICKIFREQFGSAYEKYVRPKRNQAGIYDKANAIVQYQSRTHELKN